MIQKKQGNTMTEEQEEQTEQFQITKRTAQQLAADYNCNIALQKALSYSETNADLRQIANYANGPGSEHIAAYLRHVLKICET